MKSGDTFCASDGLTLVREVGDAGQARLITIIVPAYAHESYLGDCLRSVEECSQAARISLVVIDDGSPDATLQVACDFPFSSGAHVRVYRKANCGLIDSLRRGLQLASTPYFGVMASDDRYSASGLAEVILQLANAGDRNLCWVFQAAYIGARQGMPVYSPTTAELVARHPHDRLKALSVEYPKPMLLQSTVFSTNLLRETAAWQGDVELDDWPTFVRIADWATHNAVDFRFFEKPLLAYYRTHVGGVHHNTSRQLRMCLQVAENVVRPAYRRAAIAGVYNDIALIHLYEGRPAQALRLYLRAIAASPSLATTLHAPRRVVKAALSRAAHRIGKMAASNATH